MGLRAYIIKRLIYSVFLVFFVLTLNFIIFQLMPGNPIETFVGGLRVKNPDMIPQILALYGFDQPLPVRYGKYMYNMITFQFGASFFSGKPIANEIGERLLNTLILMGLVEILSIAIGVGLGVIAAHKRGGIFDSVSVVTSLTTYSLPSFWMGMVLLLVFYYQLGWFPGAGIYPRDWAIIYRDTGGLPPRIMLGNLFGTTLALPGLEEIAGRLMHLALPTITLTLFSYGGYLLLTRATMLEALTEDYIVTARAKGVKERTVLFKHALKNASLPIITSAALTFGFILQGAIISEQVFTYPGLGKWIWDSISFNDYPAMQAIFYLIALCVIAANLIADLLYGVIDPRIKYG